MPFRDAASRVELAAKLGRDGAEGGVKQEEEEWTVRKAVGYRAVRE